MSFFQDFNKVKKQQDILELKDLNLNDGDTQIKQMTQMAQARIKNFEKVYHYLDEEIILSTTLKKLDEIPLLVKEAKGDLDEMLRIIREMQQVQLFKKTENSHRQQTVAKLTQVFQESNDRLKKITDKLQQKQKSSLQSAKQSLAHNNSHNDSQLEVQLMDDAYYDEQFVEKRQKQINDIGQVVIQLGQMMNDAATMIQDQGLKIDVIVDNVGSAKRNVKAANQEMDKAQSVQKGNNGKILFFCGVTTLIVVIIVLLFSAGSRKHTEPQQPQN